MRTSKQIQAWRVQRLQAMARKEGGNSALGRRLGYRDGAFVGQMLRGERPISERTVLAIHDLPGYAGWFDDSQQQEERNMGTDDSLLHEGELPRSLDVLAKALNRSDDITLDQARVLFTHLMNAPTRAPEIVPRLSALLA